MKIAKKHIERINDLISMSRAGHYMAKAMLEKANKESDFVEVTKLQIESISWTISGHNYAITLYEEYGIEIDGIAVNKSKIAVEEDRHAKLTAILESVIEAA